MASDDMACERGEGGVVLVVKSYVAYHSFISIVGSIEISLFMIIITIIMCEES